MPISKLGCSAVAGFEGFLAQSGLPTVLAWPIIIGEALGGMAILTGFYSRVVSVALLPVLLGALVIHAPNGWVFNAPMAAGNIPRFWRSPRSPTR